MEAHECRLPSGVELLHVADQVEIYRPDYGRFEQDVVAVLEVLSSKGPQPARSRLPDLEELVHHSLGGHGSLGRVGRVGRRLHGRAWGRKRLARRRRVAFLRSARRSLLRAAGSRNTLETGDGLHRGLFRGVSRRRGDRLDVAGLNGLGEKLRADRGDGARPGQSLLRPKRLV